jgi:serine/threonine-protein kinase
MEPLVERTAEELRPIRVGDVLAGRYLIDGILGRNEKTRIFAARNTDTGQPVALKVLEPIHPADDQGIERFLAEARGIASLLHPNSIRIYDFGRDEQSRPYLAMELLFGLSLRDELRKRASEIRAFSEREAAEIGIAVTKSLAEAHAARLVHGHLSPDTIFLHRPPREEPIVKVLDFGMARDRGASYLSPEQAQGRALDARSDLFTLGVVLLQLAMGTAEPERNLEEATMLSERFLDLVRHAIETDPADRYSDADAMRAALEGFLNGSPRALAGPDIAPPTVTMSKVTELVEDENWDAATALDELEPETTIQEPPNVLLLIPQVPELLGDSLSEPQPTTDRARPPLRPPSETPVERKPPPPPPPPSGIGPDPTFSPPTATHVKPPRERQSDLAFVAAALVVLALALAMARVIVRVQSQPLQATAPIEATTDRAPTRSAPSRSAPPPVPAPVKVPPSPPAQKASPTTPREVAPEPAKEEAQKTKKRAPEPVRKKRPPRAKDDAILDVRM